MAAKILKAYNVNAEVIDLISIRPIDIKTLICSIGKTRRCLVVDHGDPSCSLSSEIIACVSEHLFNELKSPPARLSLPLHPIPTSHQLAAEYYPTAETIANRVLNILDISEKIPNDRLQEDRPKDQPNKLFNGPF
jgi:pyruvate/2-oxoglutarate/acetoin dehydrogenase E1 component